MHLKKTLVYNTLYKWTKFLTLEIAVFGLNMTVDFWQARMRAVVAATLPARCHLPLPPQDQALAALPPMAALVKRGAENSL